METLTKKIERTRQGLARQGKTLVGRTAGAARQAGDAFGGEVREASLGFARFVEREAKSWVSYAAARRKHAAGAAAAARQMLVRRDLERRALVRAQRALAELQARVQRQVDRLDARELAEESRRGAALADRQPAARETEPPAEAKAPPSGTKIARTRKPRPARKQQAQA